MFCRLYIYVHKAAGVLVVRCALTHNCWPSNNKNIVQVQANPCARHLNTSLRRLRRRHLRRLRRHYRPRARNACVYRKHMLMHKCTQKSSAFSSPPSHIRSLRTWHHHSGGEMYPIKIIHIGQIVCGAAAAAAAASTPPPPLPAVCCMLDYAQEQNLMIHAHAASSATAAEVEGHVLDGRAFLLRWWWWLLVFYIFQCHRIGHT